MEGLHTVKALLQNSDWMVKIDLKNAFFVVPIAPQRHHLLLFNLGILIHSNSIISLHPVHSLQSVHQNP